MEGSERKTPRRTPGSGIGDWMDMGSQLWRQTTGWVGVRVCASGGGSQAAGWGCEVPPG